jgi:hypothetical protein
VVLLMAIALVGPSTAFAAAESNYASKPNTPTTPTTPTTGTAPSKESSSPKTSPSPTSETSPSTTATTPEAEKTSTLPFTGFDLRWSVGIGLLLMGAGFSIVVVQRRQRREH